mgnify:CR=1 FL=1
MKFINLWKRGCYMFNNDKASALKVLKHILKKNPRNEKAKQALQML